MNHLTFEWKEFKAQFFYQVLFALTRTLFGGANNEMTNTSISYIHVYKE